MGPTYAGVLGPVAFLTVMARGLIASHSAASTLPTALVCLFAFAALGYAVGQLADFVVWESVRARLDRELRNHAANEADRTAKR